MKRVILLAFALVLGSLWMALAQDPDKPDIPLTEPREIIKVAPAPADAEPKISRDKAIQLARKYSGFEVGKTVEAKLVLYADTEHPRGEDRPLFPYHQPVLAWLVWLPTASFELEGPEEKRETIKCPLHVGIHAESGRFLGAYGDSATKWTKGGPNPAGLWSNCTFAEADRAPRVTVREVLQTYGHRPSPTGQVFVRYLKVTAEFPKTTITRTEGADEGLSILPPFNCWLYSQRGVVLYGFSVPPDYRGPRLYGTCCDYILSDQSGKRIMGTEYK